MRIITVLYDQSAYTYRWLKPLFAAKNEFKLYGYKVEYISFLDYLPLNKILDRAKREMYILNKAMKGHRDIVFMAFHHSTSWIGSLDKAERIEIVKKIKIHCSKLVWLDTADSTGTCSFEVMPYVDLYLKKQILKDKSMYLNPIWGGRVFCQYYHDMLHLEDESITNKKFEPLGKQYLDKLRVSWNVGVGDLFATRVQLFLHPYSRVVPKFISPVSGKILDLQYRGSSYSPVAGYQRQKCLELVMGLNHISHSDALKRIPKKEYIKEGQRAKAILSPFGWGEICGRDFEAFVYGATMIKPSMDHCVTYPDAYIDNLTYIPIKWDFSDFNEKIDQIGTAKFKKVAIDAQEFYKKHFSKNFYNEFATHIVNELER